MDITRRTFIKASGGTVALGLIGMQPTLNWIRPASAEKDLPEKVAYTFHPPNCGGRCSHKCTVRDGKLVKIEANEWPDETFTKICQRGISEVERVYSPDRLKTPLKRVGERGEGKFVAISWEEALSTIVENMKGSIDKYGANSILFFCSTGIPYTMPLLPKLLGAQYPTYPYHFGYDVGTSNGQYAVIGAPGGGSGLLAAGINTNEITDNVNSNMVILWGNNLLETSLPDAATFFDIKEKGVKIVYIDPVYTTTAAKSHQWIPIKAGTDNAMLMSMVHLVLANQWYDAEYAKNYTTAPFLIREDDQTILRDEQTQKYLVWDKNSNSVKPCDAPGIDPELEGEFNVNGVNVKTVLTGFREHTKDNTPAWASKITDVPEQVIYDLTKEYALGGPACIQWGLGALDKYYHTDTTGRLGAMLAALTGNIGISGGGIGPGKAHKAAWPAKLTAWSLPPEFKLADAEGHICDYQDTPNSAKVLFMIGNVLHQSFPNYNRTTEWAKSLDFIAAVEYLHSDSMNYADIVLPACSVYETEYDVGVIATEKSHILLQQKVIDPLFESKSDFQIEKELAQRFGFDQYMPATPEDYVRSQLQSPDPIMQGITVENLLANQCIMRLNAPNKPYVGYADFKFGTESTRAELYNQIFLEDNCPFPIWEEQNEASSMSPLFKKYPLIFGTPHTRFRSHSSFSNSRWLLQINNEPMIRINPKDALSRGIKNQDFVEVFNDRGSFECRCQLAEDMRPGMVQISEGWWSRYFRKGDPQELINPNKNPRAKKLPYGHIIGYSDTLVEVRKAEV